MLAPFSFFKEVREVTGDHLNTFDSKFKGPSGPPGSVFMHLRVKIDQ